MATLIEVHQGPINTLRLLDDSEFILSGGSDCIVRLTHADGETISFTREHTGSVNALDSNDTTIAVSGGDFDLIVLWDIITQRKLKQYRTDPNSIQNNEIMDVKLIGDLIISGGSNTHINFMDLRIPNTKPIWRLDDANDNITSLDYCHDNQSLHATCMNGYVYSYDMRKCTLTLDETSNNGLFDINVYDKGKLMLTTGDSLEFRDIDTFDIRGQVKRDHVTHQANSVLFESTTGNKNKSTIATGSNKGCVALWELSDTKKEKVDIKEVPSLQIPGASDTLVVNKVQYSSCNNRVYASSWDGRLHYWDLE